MIIEVKKTADVIQTDTSYKISAKEIKRILKIDKGEIISINLWRGRSPDDEAKGVSPDKDVWEINIREIAKEKKE